jgi:hypothetical protein
LACAASAFRGLVALCGVAAVAMLGFYAGVLFSGGLLTSHGRSALSASSTQRVAVEAGALRGAGGGGGAEAETSRCAAAPPFDAAAATAALRGLTDAVTYENTSVCQDLGPACIMAGGDVLLYAPRYQPAGGRYTPVETNTTAALARMMYHVFWGEPDAGLGGVDSEGAPLLSGNADQFLKTMKRYEKGVGLRLWPGELTSLLWNTQTHAESVAFKTALRESAGAHEVNHPLSSLSINLPVCLT